MAHTNNRRTPVVDIGLSRFVRLLYLGSHSRSGTTNGVLSHTTTELCTTSSVNTPGPELIPQSTSDVMELFLE